MSVSSAASFTFPVQSEQVVAGSTSGIGDAQADDGTVEALAEVDVDLTPDSVTNPTSRVSVQRGSATLAAGAANVDVPITAVAMSQAFLVFSASFDNTAPGESQVSGQITSATTLRFERSDTTGPAISLVWYVAEFTSGVSVQRGGVAMSSTTVNVGLTSVDTAKSFPIISYRKDGVAYGADDYVRAKITSPTNLELTIDSAAPTGTVEWQVVEYRDSNVQTGDISWAVADVTRTASVTSADAAKAWLLFTYTSADGTTTDIGQKMVRGVVTNPTTLTFDRDRTGQIVTMTWYLVVFTDNTRVQSASAGFTAIQTQNDIAITSVGTAKTIASAGGAFHRGGKTPYDVDDNPGTATVTLDLTSATNLRMTRAATGSQTADVGWFVVEFGDVSIGSWIAGTLPTDIETEDGVSVQYREADALNEIGVIAFKSATGSGVNFPKQLDWTGAAWGTPETELGTAGAVVRSVRTVWNASAGASDFYIAVEANAVITVYRCMNVDTCAPSVTATTQTVGAAPERHWDIAVESSGDVLLVYDNSASGANDFCYKTRSAGTGSWSAETCFNHPSIASSNPSIAYITLASNLGSDRIALGAADTTNDDIVLGMWDGSSWLTGAHQATLTTAYAPTAGLGVGVYAEESADEFVAYGSNGADSVRECEWTLAGGWEATASCASFDPEVTSIGVDATSSGSVTGAVSSITVSHTTGTGTNRLMLVGVTVTNDGAAGARVLNSVRYGGVDLTQVTTVSVADDARVWIYRLINPASGTADVVATFDGTVASGGGIVMGVMTFTGVDPATPLGTPVTEAEGDGSITVAAANNELIFDTISTEDATALSAGADQTQRWALRPDSVVGGGGSTQPGTANDIMSWTQTSSSHRAQAGVTIRPARTNAKAFTEGGWREGSNSVLLCASTDIAVLACWEWSGVAGTGGARQGLLEATANDGSGTTIALPGGVDWNPDQTGVTDGLLVYYANSPGFLAYRTYDDGTNTFSSASTLVSAGTHLWAEVVGTELSGDTVKAHVCTSNSNFDVLCYRWTGSGAPASQQSITADSVDETYRYWSLAFQETPSGSGMEVRYDWVGVPSGSSYTLSVKGSRQDEDVVVQVLTPPSTWNTRITITATSNTLYTYALTSAEYNSGAPSIRFVDSVVGEAAPSDLFLDWVAITTSYLQYSLDVRHNITGIIAFSSAVLVVKGSIPAGGENFDISVWNYTAAAWDLFFSSSFTPTNEYHNATLARDYISAGTSQVRFVDAATQDGTQWALNLDFVAVVLTNVAPSLANEGATPSLGYVTTSFSFFVRFADAENDPPLSVDLVLDGLPYGMLENSTGDTNFADGKDYYLNQMIGVRGVYNYSFTARSAAGDPAIATTVTRQVTVANRNPSISNPISADNVHTSRSYVRDFDAGDPDNDSLSWSLSTNASWLAVGPANGTVWGAAPPTATASYANATVSDGVGGSAWVNFTISVGNVRPVITTPAVATLSVYRRAIVQYDLNATDADGDVLTWTLQTNASFLSIGAGTGTVFGVAASIPGAFWFEATVSDDFGGVDRRTVTLLVLNRPPQVAVSAPSSVSAEDPYSGTFSGTDPDDDTLTWSISTNATWLTMNPSTGDLSGTPIPGVYYVNLTARDPYGGVASYNFTITVAPGPSPPPGPTLGGLRGEPWFFLLIALAFVALCILVIAPRRRPLIEAAFALDRGDQILFQYAAPDSGYDEPRLRRVLEGVRWRETNTISDPPYSLHTLARATHDWILISRSDDSDRVTRSAQKFIARVARDIQGFAVEPESSQPVGET